MKKQRYGYVKRIDGVVNVRIMAEAEGYFMVRRKGCMPFVVSKKEIKDIYED